jgi:hypothetical protein
VQYNTPCGAAYGSMTLCFTAITVLQNKLSTYPQSATLTLPVVKACLPILVRQGVFDGASNVTRNSLINYVFKFSTHSLLRNRGLGTVCFILLQFRERRHSGFAFWTQIRIILYAYCKALGDAYAFTLSLSHCRLGTVCSAVLNWRK